MIERLLKAGADVNAIASWDCGRTALKGAAEKGHLEIVDKLFESRADANAIACWGSGRTALQGPAEQGH